MESHQTNKPYDTYFEWETTNRHCQCESTETWFNTFGTSNVFVACAVMKQTFGDFLLNLISALPRLLPRCGGSVSLSLSLFLSQASHETGKTI